MILAPEKYTKDFVYTGTLRAIYPLSPRRSIPPHIEKPDYALHPQGNYQLNK